jgi:hypothetical protein
MISSVASTGWAGVPSSAMAAASRRALMRSPSERPAQGTRRRLSQHCDRPAQVVEIRCQASYLGHDTFPSFGVAHNFLRNAGMAIEYLALGCVQVINLTSFRPVGAGEQQVGDACQGGGHDHQVRPAPARIPHDGYHLGECALPTGAAKFPTSAGVALPGAVDFVSMRFLDSLNRLHKNTPVVLGRASSGALICDQPRPP